MAWNGKLVQTNVTHEGGYPFLNCMKGAQAWSGVNTPALVPSEFDNNGYLKTTSTSGGVNTAFYIPTQFERPGVYILDWTGDGTVTTGSTNASAYTATITSVTQSGGIQTVTVPSGFSTYLIAGMPIQISGITGGSGAGSWGTSFSGKVWQIASVLSTTQFTINSGQTFTGSIGYSSALITSVTTTTLSGSGTKNGSGRYVFQPLTATYNGIDGMKAFVTVSATDYPTSWPTNIRFYHSDDETLLNAGQVFSTKFLTHMSNFGVLRFLTWGQGNYTNATTWRTRIPQTYYTYIDHAITPWIYAGTTTSSVGASGITYSISSNSITRTSDGTTWSSGAAADKDTLSVTFNQSAQAHIASFTAGNPTTVTLTGASNDATFVNSNSVKIWNIGDGTGGAGQWSSLNGTWTISNVSGNTFTIPVNSSAFTGAANIDSAYGGNVAHTGIFFNVNSSGAVSIVDAYSQTFTSSVRVSQFPIAGTFQSLGTLTYDSTLNAFIKFGGSQEMGSVGLLSTPVEICLRLCSDVGAHPYFTMPPFACDPPTDWLPELMNYIRTNYSWMIPRFEGPNELWNTASGFMQTTHATAKATAWGWTSPSYHQWYGKTVSCMGQIGKAVYGSYPGAATDYQIIAGVQTVTGTSTSSSNNRLEWASWSAPSTLTWSGGTVNFSATAAAPTGGSTATNYVSHICCAQYFNPSAKDTTAGQTNETALASAFSGGQFVVSSIVNGLMTVASFTKGTALAVGQYVFGPGIGNVGHIGNVGYGTLPKIASLGTGTGGAGTYQLDNANINISYRQTFYSGVDLTAPITYAATAVDCTFVGTITGSSLAVSSITSGYLVSGSSSVLIRGGTISFGSNVYATAISGSYPNYTLTLNTSPGNQSGVTFQQGLTYSLTGCATLFANWATWANNHNIKKMCGYEGCYSPDYAGTATNDLLRSASKQAPLMYDYNMTNYTNFVSNGSYPGGFTAEFPSYFVANGFYPSTSVWTGMEDIYSSIEPPSVVAARLRSNRKRRFRVVAS